MDFELNAKQVQVKQDRYHAQAANSRLMAELGPQESWVMAARRKLESSLIRVRRSQPVVTAQLLPDPDALAEPATAVQTSH
ncbi:hypothetical protein BH23CHL3_BH23CHL3_10680 [soil metagenome]|jgi:hypothetical protein